MISFFIIFLLTAVVANGSGGLRTSASHSSHHPLLVRGACEHNVWRTDESASLPGRCFGVNPTKEFDDLKDIKIANRADCRALCCNLDTRCTTWQYHNSSSTCFIQKRPVRRGFEGADTPLFCDPYPVHSWNGKFLGERRAAGGSAGKYTCSWAYTLPKQCFAFGPERLKAPDGAYCSFLLFPINTHTHKSNTTLSCPPTPLP